MPMRKDDIGNRWVEMEVLVPGTPEQVWQAMATGPGTTAWFTPTRIEEQVGGAVEFDFGEMGTSTGEVTAWEPPYRFGYIERDWAEGAPPVATEITVTGRSGDRCVVRMVHSLFTSAEDWDDQLEGFEKGWQGFFEVLRLYLAHHAGEPSASFSAEARSAAPQAEVWQRLTETLGLGCANVDDQRTLSQGAQALSGVVHRVHQVDDQRLIVLRLSGPVPGIALVGTYNVGDSILASLQVYLYGEQARSAAESAAGAWNDRLAEVLGRQ